MQWQLYIGKCWIRVLLPCPFSSFSCSFMKIWLNNRLAPLGLVSLGNPGSESRMLFRGRHPPPSQIDGFFFCSTKLTAFFLFHRDCYRPQTKFPKVMFSLVSVCPWGGGLHTHSPGAPPGQAPPGQAPPWADPPPKGGSPRAGTPSPWAGTHLRSACWDTVNKRAVRIPLECILVLVAVGFVNSAVMWHVVVPRGRCWFSQILIIMLFMNGNFRRQFLTNTKSLIRYCTYNTQ